MTGVVTGVVMDHTGVPLPGAKVTLIAADVKSSTTCDIRGRYLVRGVPMGRATVTATLNGFAPRERCTDVHAGITSVLDLKLCLGPDVNIHAMFKTPMAERVREMAALLLVRVIKTELQDNECEPMVTAKILECLKGGSRFAEGSTLTLRPSSYQGPYPEGADIVAFLRKGNLVNVEAPFVAEGGVIVRTPKGDFYEEYQGRSLSQFLSELRSMT